MLSTKRIGTITEYECAVHLMKLGCVVNVPLGEDCLYDLIADYQNNLLRVQVKHANPVSGGFEISCTSTQINATRIEDRKYPPNAFEYFGTVFDNRCYLIPFDPSIQRKKIRLDRPLNSQLANITWGYEVEAEYILAKQSDVHARPRVDMTAIITAEKQSEQHSKYMASKHTGAFWVTDGTISQRLPAGSSIPEGFRKGRVMPK